MSVALKYAGLDIGSDISTSMTVSGQTVESQISSFLFPVTYSGIPRLSDAYDGDVMTADTTGMISVTNYLFREVGGSTLQTGAGSTLDTTGLGGTYVEVEVTYASGTATSPPIQVFVPMTDANMNAEDKAINAMLPHTEATHIAVASGNWSDPATWGKGRVPRNGARVLVPNGLTVVYNYAQAGTRLDSVRVDGELTWAINQSTSMFVETLICTRGATVTIGTEQNPLPSQHTATITYSSRDYSQQGYDDTDLNKTRDDFLWIRGGLFLGTFEFCGTEASLWHLAEPIPVGATSLTLLEAPTGWAAGDEILIGGTRATWGTDGTETTNIFNKEDEVRIIDSVVDNTITWTTPLANAHDNQLAGSNRTDLYPVILRKNGKNIVFRSESALDVPRRGHMASIHPASFTKGSGASFIDLGRTDKSYRAGKLTNSNTELRVSGTSTDVENIPADARSNLLARYSYHFHLNGTGGQRSTIRNCYFDGSPGHLLVHHDSDVVIDNCAGTEFYGCFLVAEQGSEIGDWIRCLAIGTSYNGRSINLEIGPKNAEIDRGTQGDNFIYGCGFGNRGRATRNAGSYAVSCTYGHVYYPRDANEVVQPTKNIKRDVVPLTKSSLLANGTETPVGEWNFVDHPIIGLTDAVGIACGYGFFVTKEKGQQSHDVQVYFKRPKAWGCIDVGMMVEYVGTYLIEDGDFVAGTQGVGNGFLAGVNAHGIGCHRLQTEGWETGFLGLGSIEGDDGWDAFHNADNPRQYNIGHTSINDTTAETLNGGGSFSVEDIDNTAVDLDAEPTDTLPLQMTEWDGNDILTNEVTNADGKKQDNLSSAADIVVKPNTDPVMKISPGWKCKTWTSSYGYWQYNGDNVAVLDFIISDRVTGRHAKVTKLANAGANTPPGNNGGVWTYDSPVTASDITTVVALNTPVTLDVIALSSPAGGDGATYVIDQTEYIPPSHGLMTVDSTTQITFTPDVEHTGADFTEVFVESGGHYKTVRINFLIGGTGAAIPDPVADTDFTATDAAEALTIDLTLLEPPDVDGRHILYVQYTTDAGATWRRVCNGWKESVFKLTVLSDGTPISNTVYTVGIRYKTDYDYGTSGIGSDSVTVS